MIKKAFIYLIPFVFLFSTVQAEEFDDGIEFITIKQPVKTSHPDKVVVTELFWYGCPHCFRFEPYIEKWNHSKPEGVVFEQVPSVLNPSWTEHARTYYTLEAMGVTEQLHNKIFNALHIQNKRLTSLDTMAAFVAEQGVDEKLFREHYHSFPVDSKVRKGKQKERKYGHQGVPAVVINGKYRTSASMAGSNSRMISVINYLVGKELAAKP